MKKKERDELKLKTIEELENVARGLEEDIFKMRLDKAQNKLKNQRLIYSNRKRIAFALTLINEKQMEEKAVRETKKGSKKQ